MNITTFIFGVVPAMEEGDAISATCLKGAVWLRLYPGCAFLKSFGDGWLCLENQPAEALAEAVVEKGGEKFVPFGNLIKKTIGLGCESPSDKMLRGSGILYMSDEMGCDETPFDVNFEDALLVYRVIDSSDETPPIVKAGNKVDLPSFESDPDNELVLIAKS